MKQIQTVIFRIFRVNTRSPYPTICAQIRPFGGKWVDAKFAAVIVFSQPIRLESVLSHLAQTNFWRIIKKNERVAA